MRNVFTDTNHRVRSRLRLMPCVPMGLTDTQSGRQQQGIHYLIDVSGLLHSLADSMLLSPQGQQARTGFTLWCVGTRLASSSCRERLAGNPRISWKFKQGGIQMDDGGPIVTSLWRHLRLLCALHHSLLIFFFFLSRRFRALHLRRSGC